MRGWRWKVLATLVTVEEAPRDVLDRVAAMAMKNVPQLVGVTWSKERSGQMDLMGLDGVHQQLPNKKQWQSYSQLGWLFPILVYGKIKNVPNHQPVYNLIFHHPTCKSPFSSCSALESHLELDLEAGGWRNYAAKSNLAQRWFATSRASGWKALLTMRPDGSWAEKFNTLV